jgi:hypothetical protein
LEKKDIENHKIIDNNKKLGPGEYNPKYISVNYLLIRLL